jgi:hypothetical protein
MQRDVLVVSPVRFKKGISFERLLMVAHPCGHARHVILNLKKPLERKAPYKITDKVRLREVASGLGIKTDGRPEKDILNEILDRALEDGQSSEHLPDMNIINLFGLYIFSAGLPEGPKAIFPCTILQSRERAGRRSRSSANSLTVLLPFRKRSLSLMGLLPFLWDAVPSEVRDASPTLGRTKRGGKGLRLNKN